MNFSQALEKMKQGHKVKRPHWGGYWDMKGGTIVIHTKDGEALDLFNTKDKEYTLHNMAADDFEIAEDGNTPILGGVARMDFGHALYMMKKGLRVKREGWNGKNQYIELATNISYKNAGGKIVNAEHDAIGNRAIAFVGTSGVQVGWLASQADMLAEDWIIAESGKRDEK